MNVIAQALRYADFSEIMRHFCFYLPSDLHKGMRIAWITSEHQAPVKRLCPMELVLSLCDDVW